jgi:hypothetical protein
MFSFSRNELLFVAVLFGECWSLCAEEAIRFVVGAGGKPQSGRGAGGADDHCMTTIRG